MRIMVIPMVRNKRNVVMVNQSNYLNASMREMHANNADLSESKSQEGNRWSRLKMI